MTLTKQAQSIADLVHEQSVEILIDVGFCVPDDDLLARLEGEGFQVDQENQMVRLYPEQVDLALKNLPKKLKFYNRDGEQLTKFGQEACFMGAGTPVNVFDLHSGEHRPSTRADVRQIVTIQDALSQVDIVRPTVTATDHRFDSNQDQAPALSCRKRGSRWVKRRALS